jgi:RHS repeat-associated protein
VVIRSNHLESDSCRNHFQMRPCVLRWLQARTTVYVYDAAGQLAAEHAPSSTSGRRYLSVDHLGSTRLVTNSTGQAMTCSDYLPFGEEIFTGTPRTARAGVSCYGANLGTSQKFTGKERDLKSDGTPLSGLDYFGARYHSGAQGRFTSPDPKNAGADPESPQSWNAYAYSLNNPLKYVDPDGESATLAGALGGAIVGGAVAAWRGESVWKGAVSGAVAGALAGAVIDTGGAALGLYGAAAAGGGAGWRWRRAGWSCTEWPRNYGYRFGSRRVGRRTHGNSRSCAWTGRGSRSATTGEWCSSRSRCGGCVEGS